MRRLLVVLLVLVALAGCSGDDEPRTATAPPTSAPVTGAETTTTVVEVLSLSDKGFSEACGERALDVTREDSGTTVLPNVAGYITWLRHSAYARLRELADEMAQRDPAEVAGAVSELTRICAQAGFELP